MHDSEGNEDEDYAIVMLMMLLLLKTNTVARRQRRKRGLGCELVLSCTLINGPAAILKVCFLKVCFSDI